MSPIQLVVTDIDGTVVREGTTALSPQYYDIIKALHAKGLKIIIASGRPVESIAELFAPVQDCISIIGNGGLSIRETADEQEYMLDPIPREWVEELEQDLDSLPDIEGFFCASGISFVHYEDSEVMRLLTHGYRANIRAVGGVGCLPEVPIGKVSLFHAKEIIPHIPQSFWDKWQGRLNLTISGDYWLDCVMPEVSKGHALQILLDKWALSPEVVLASGDQMNDASMLRLAGRSIAVSNATPALLEWADEVHENADFLAVARAWQALL